MEKICEKSDKIRFHDRSSGFRLEAKCQGRIAWTVTLVGEVIVENATFLTLTIVNEAGMVLDSTISISNDDSLASRELKLKTVDGDWIEVTFERSRQRTHNKWTHRR